MNLQLDQKSVLITGGAGVIGSAAARCFLEEGASVAVADLETNAAAPAMRELEERFPGRVAFFPFDLCDASGIGIANAVSRILDRFGGIDIVVNNAAVFHFSPLLTWESTAPLDSHYEVGLKGPVTLLREVWKQHRPALGGSVVNVSSVAGHVGEPDAFAYTPIKAAQKGLTLSCALEMAPHGGWAVSISPGHTWGDVHKSRADAEGLDRRAYENTMPNIASTLFGRFLEPEEIGRWIAIAASPLGKPLSGQDLHVTLGIEPGGFNRAYKTTVPAT